MCFIFWGFFVCFLLTADVFWKYCSFWLLIFRYLVCNSATQRPEDLDILVLVSRHCHYKQSQQTFCGLCFLFPVEGAIVSYFLKINASSLFLITYTPVIIFLLEGDLYCFISLAKDFNVYLYYKTCKEIFATFELKNINLMLWSK